MWLHVDGAYGAPAVLTDKGKASADEGIGAAQTLSRSIRTMSCFVIRGWLRAGAETARCYCAPFQVMPEYLRDTEGGSGEIHSETMECS